MSDLAHRLNVAVLKYRHAEITIGIPVGKAFIIASQLQLAQRHPAVTDVVLGINREFVAALQEDLAAIDPAFGEALEQGNDRSLDVQMPARGSEVQS